jgi:hypothetical protein
MPIASSGLTQSTFACFDQTLSGPWTRMKSRVPAKPFPFALTEAPAALQSINTPEIIPFFVDKTTFAPLPGTRSALRRSEPGVFIGIS